MLNKMLAKSPSGFNLTCETEEKVLFGTHDYTHSF